MSFKDHFSKQAGDYAKYRPVYPPALFEYLASLVSRHELAWDAGTGSGQAALGLAAHFQRIVATDPSAAQIRNAVPHPRVEYRVAPAEQTDLADAGVDLIAVAQALHWFDLDRFYREVRRVLRPGGALAAWCYGLNEVGPEVDEIVRRFYSETVGPYWPPERRYIDEQYRTIPFPFTEPAAPVFDMSVSWTLEEFIGYLGTWSAVQRYARERGQNPLKPIHDDLRRAWGSPPARRRVTWPIHLRVGIQPAFISRPIMPDR